MYDPKRDVANEKGNQMRPVFFRSRTNRHNGSRTDSVRSIARQNRLRNFV